MKISRGQLISQYFFFQNPIKYLMDDRNVTRSIQGICVLLIAAYVFVKVNFCIFRAARGILTLIGLMTVCCVAAQKYESLPEPIILAINSIRINSFEFLKAFYKLVASLNLVRR